MWRSAARPELDRASGTNWAQLGRPYSTGPSVLLGLNSRVVTHGRRDHLGRPDRPTHRSDWTQTAPPDPRTNRPTVPTGPTDPRPTGATGRQFWGGPNGTGLFLPGFHGERSLDATSAARYLYFNQRRGFARRHCVACTQTGSSYSA